MATDPSDLAKSISRIGDYYSLVIPLGGTLVSGQDYLGDTSADSGVPMPDGTLQDARVLLSADDDGNTEIQFDNESRDDNHSFALDADSYTEETGIGLNFSEGEELSAHCTTTTTPGDGLSIHVLMEVNQAPMN